jgi:16S rRNA (guanine527-N7)-methyltransferase
MKEEFRRRLITAIKDHHAGFRLELGQPQIDRLADFYDIVEQNNDLLHLVAPTSPEEFAVRHILESLTLLEHLHPRATFADVGPGAGLPSIPCLLVREDLSAVLIESKVKKAEYLAKAVRALGLSRRVEVVNKQFEEARGLEPDAVTCRALDKLTEKLPKLLKWARGRDLLLFGGPSLEEALERAGRTFSRSLMPMSDQRYLFVVR